jgi:hypothetical protein
MAVQAAAIVFTAEGETSQLYNSPAQVGFLSVFIWHLLVFAAILVYCCCH